MTTLIFVKDRLARLPKNAPSTTGEMLMPRWEFHLTQDGPSNAIHWVWMYRRENGDSITSARPFPSYGECIRDAVSHGYSAKGIRPFRDKTPARPD